MNVLPYPDILQSIAKALSGQHTELKTCDALGQTWLFPGTASNRLANQLLQRPAPSNHHTPPHTSLTVPAHGR